MRRSPTLTEIRLDIAPILDATPRRFVFLIGGVAYETMDGLKMYLESMPKGRTLVLDPGCMRMGGEPLIDSNEEMAAFQAFLATIGVPLKIIPSG